MEPTPVIPLEYAEPERAHSPVWSAIIRVSHAVALAFCLLSTFWIAFISTRYGVLGGVPIFAAGVLLVIGGSINRNRTAVALGICHVGVCLLFILLVNLLRLNPTTAHGPMTIMGTIYTTAAVAAALWRGVFWRLARTS